MTDHLSADDVAVYLEGQLSDAQRSRTERHFAECDECRAELVELSRLFRTRPRKRRWYLPVGVAAAAAVALWMLYPSIPPPTNFREPAVTTTLAPVVIAPRGRTAQAPTLVWTRVPHAERYRVTLFDSSGTVLWESQSPPAPADTSVVLPVHLRPGARYFWQVEAETGFHRSVKSDVVEFTLIP